MKTEIKERVKKGVKFTISSQEPVVVMPESVYEELMEVVEVMGDKELWKRVSAAEKRVKRGELVRWGDMKKKYGL